MTPFLASVTGRTLLQQLVLFALILAVAPIARATGIVSDFENDTQVAAWSFHNGPEFPGARGKIIGTTSFGRKCAELQYDFTKPADWVGTFDPHYVSATSKVTDAQSTGAKRLRLLMQLSDAGVRPSVRVRDSSGQILQYSVQANVPLWAGAAQSWTVVQIDLSKPARYWSGLNNGSIQYPIKEIVILADATNRRNTGFIRFDDVELLPAATSESIFALTDGSLNPPLAPIGDLAKRVGVNVHFTKEDTTMDLIGAAGFKWIRADLNWNWVERNVGKYDFAVFDGLVTAAQSRGMSVVAILDYGHQVHTGGASLPPRTAAAISAYTSFASAAAKYFAGKPVVFEVWNEPDIPGVWGGVPSSAEYGALLRATIDAVKAASPSSIVLTGGLSSPYEKTYTFWDDLEKRGAMAGASGWGAHLYADAGPETRWLDILELKSRAARVMPGKQLWSTEWGYSSTKLSPTQDGHSATARNLQAVMKVRQLLISWWGDLPLSIVYSIRDGGNDPANYQHNFGLLTYGGTEKPAMTAVRHLMTIAKGRSLAGIIAGGTIPEHVNIMRLDNSAGKLYVVWTGGNESSAIVKIPDRRARVWDVFGKSITPRRGVTEDTLAISAAAGPVYIEIPNL